MIWSNDGSKFFTNERTMRFIALPMALIATSCGQAATDFGLNDFYLNCYNETGSPVKTFYIDEGRKKISELDESGELYLVCDGCETILSQSVIKWTIDMEDGRKDITTIDRRTGKYYSETTDPNAPPVYVGNVAVPADVMSFGMSLNCQRANGPPEAKF